MAGGSLGRLSLSSFSAYLSEAVSAELAPVPGADGFPCSEPMPILADRQKFWGGMWYQPHKYGQLVSVIQDARSRAGSPEGEAQLSGEKNQHVLRDYSDKKSQGPDRWKPAELKALPVQLADELAAV